MMFLLLVQRRVDYTLKKLDKNPNLQRKTIVFRCRDKASFSEAHNDRQHAIRSALCTNHAGEVICDWGRSAAMGWMQCLEGSGGAKHSLCSGGVSCVFLNRWKRCVRSQKKDLEDFLSLTTYRKARIASAQVLLLRICRGFLYF